MDKKAQEEWDNLHLDILYLEGEYLSLEHKSFAFEERRMIREKLRKIIARMVKIEKAHPDK